MNNTFKPAGDLGIPIAVDVAAIEKDLTSLWKSAGKNSAIMRSSSCNFLAIVKNRQAAEAFQPALAKLSQTHPCRSIVAFPESGDPEILAWIRAQCSIPFYEVPQVCCESIMLAARGEAIRNLPNTLLSLLIPNLPVYLYWRSFQIADRELIEQMVRFSNLLIVDSHQSREDPQNRLRLLQLLIDPPGGISIRDLNWARITPWRDLIAQFFDSKASRKYLHEISEVEIARNLSAAGSIPTRALLLTGWLASSLGWRRLAAKRSGDQWLSRWTSGEHKIQVRFTGKFTAPNQSPGINSVLLRTRSNAEFSVSVDEGSSCITATARVGDSRLDHSVPQKLLEESSILSDELSQTGKDVVFIAALAQALELEQSFLLKTV
jgi:glucose-6-phosphate dehydrogenase assembly protein OpcA